MFVASVHIPVFSDATARTLVNALSEVRTKEGNCALPGFKQTLLLRGKGDALLLTVWESRKQMIDYLSSERGQLTQRLLGEIKKQDGAHYSEYHSAWRDFRGLIPEPTRRPCDCKDS